MAPSSAIYQGRVLTGRYLLLTLLVTSLNHREPLEDSDAQ